VAVDSPASLPVFAAGLVALALLAGRRMPRLRSNP
jgi:MYXO-CTERM domain-containing protein